MTTAIMFYRQNDAGSRVLKKYRSRSGTLQFSVWRAHGVHMGLCSSFSPVSFQASIIKGAVNWLVSSTFCGQS